jgi:hypothetical protein
MDLKAVLAAYLWINGIVSGDSFTCTHCGHEDIADRVAALNYAGRYGDQEIGQYTPYCQVKTILLDRFHRRLEME